MKMNCCIVMAGGVRSPLFWVACPSWGVVLGFAATKIYKLIIMCIPRKSHQDD